MHAITPRRNDVQPQVSRVRDDAGQVWRGENPAELYRWISRRNDLLRTIAVATRSAGSSLGL